jgi:hypothetical protein
MARAGHTLVQVEGGRELRKRLRTIEGGLAELKTEHRWVANYVQGRAGPAAPRRTGALAATGRASGTNTSSIVRYGTARRVPYAAPIHYGWPARHIRPQEWVINAALRSEPVWLAHFNETIRALVERTPGTS